MINKLYSVMLIVVLNSYSQNVNFHANSFLTKSDSKNKKIMIYNFSEGKSIKYVIKDTLEDNFFETQILKKKDNRFEVKISSVYDVNLKINKGWIKQGDLSVGFRSSNQNRTIPIYNNPNINSHFFYLSSPESVIGIISDIMFVKNNQTWLKVSFILNGKKKSGWLSPENQCYNLFTMCTGE